MYETFPHTADLGLRVRAATREELFQEAARGLFSMLVLNPADIRPAQEMQLKLQGDDIEYLLFDWLSELLYHFDTEHLLLGEFNVQLDDGKLTATCRGEELDPERHQMDHEVKAITYHGLQVAKSGDAWTAEVIVDI